MRFTIALLALTLPALAMAQQAPAPAMRGDNITVQPSGTSAARSLASRFGERLNIKDFGAIGDGAANDSAALDAAVARANTLRAAGTFACIYLPPGSYAISTPPRSFVGPGCVLGDGPQRSYIRLTEEFTGTLFQWSEAWMGATYLSSNASVGIGPAPARTGPTVTVGIAGQTAGPRLVDFAVVGDRRAASPQHAFEFRDRVDFVQIFNVDCHYVPGRCIYAGATRDQAQAYLRESRIVGFRAFVSGATGFPAIDITSTGDGDATNEVVLDQIDIYAPFAEGLVIRGGNDMINPVRYIRMGSVRIEGDQSNPAGVTTPLMRLGDSSTNAIVRAISCNYCELGSPYTYALEFQPGVGLAATSPNSISIAGRIFTGAGAGGGVNVAGGSGLSLRFSGLTSAATNVTIAGPSTVASPIILDGQGAEASWSYNIASGSESAIQVPTRGVGNPATGLVVSAPTGAFGTLNLGSGGLQVPGASVTGIVLTTTGSYLATVPTLTISAPPSGGSQATAIASSMRFSQVVGTGAVTGSGCTVGDILTVQGGTTNIANLLRVVSVDGSGRPTEFSTTAGGDAFGDYTALPPDPATLTGGTCSVPPTAQVAYYVFATSVVSPGSGYVTTPTVSSSFSALGVASGTGTLSNSLPILTAAGELTLDSTGTRIGLGGVSGGPIVMQSAVRDAAAQRATPVDGGSTIVTANTSWVRWVNTSAIASHTLFLVGAQGDGQMLRISSVGGVTALTVGGATSQGWTNGTALAANTSLTFAWDAARAVWDRVQ
jgi:hypothetical protein